MLDQREARKKTMIEGVASEIGAIMFDYITKVNSRYRANEFTSSQLAKKIMSTYEVKRTMFPTVHRLVKEALRTWQEQGLCTHISCTKYSRCRKTKDTYRFKVEGLAEIKKRAIEETIRKIDQGGSEKSPIMKTREMIINDKLQELLQSMTAATENRHAT
jgi:hypothetical protein